MKPEAAKLVLDIREAIDAIQRFTEGMTFADYLGDEKTQAAVERKFEIVGGSMCATPGSGSRSVCSNPLRLANRRVPKSSYPWLRSR